MEEDAEVKWEAHQRYDPEENTSGGKVDWVLDKGLTLGKKILVAGFVMTSASIVLPPLVVISAIGFVCSVPYSIFLASYVCTEKLMSKWLPCPGTATPDSLLLGNGDDECVVTDRERGVDEGERGLGVEDITMENVYEEREGKMPSKECDMSIEGEQEENIKKEGMEETKGGADDVLGVVITIEGEDKLEGKVKEKEVPFAGDLYQGCVGDEEEKMARKTIGLIERMRDEVIAENSAVEDKQDGTDGGQGETSGNANETEKTLGDKKVDDSIDTEIPVMAIGAGNAKNGRESGEEKHDSKANMTWKGKAIGGKEFQSKKERDISPSSNAVAEGVTNRSGSNSSEGRLISNYAVYKAADALKITVSPAAKEMKHTQSSSPETISSPSNQLMYDEEQLWKQIDAVRKIVGYTVLRHDTSIEEIKALYIFTGVEPPSSFKDPSELVEINNELRVLKSIVGVE